MRFFIYLALTIAITSISSAFAYVQNQFYKDIHGDNYIVSYEEEGKWVLDHYLLRPGKLQSRELHQTFSTKAVLIKEKSIRFGNKLSRKSSKVRSKYVTTETNLKVWDVKNDWDQNWELKFSKWLEQEFNKDFFKKYNLETDCADVAFALRWIFARNNNLPALNTLAGSHILFGQNSFKYEWAKLKRDPLWHKDEVFMAALRYIMKHAFTGTLNIDGYPIELNKDTFLTGTIHLMGGHTLIISEINYTLTSSAPIWKLSSTVPSAVRELSREMMIDQSMTDASIGGLFRMRWPVERNGIWSLIPKDEMPLYSLEQYSSEFLGEFNNFTVALINRLGIKFNPKQIVIEAAESIVDSFKFRVKIVEDGFIACQKVDCSEGTFNYEEHSTPTRDKRIVAKFKTVSELVRNLSSFDSTIESYWETFKKKTEFTVLGDTKSVEELRRLFEYKLISSHPEDSLEQRWAVDQNNIELTINRRFTFKKNKRKVLVADSKLCRSTLNCEKGSANWKKYNSYELDLDLIESIFTSYHKMCELYPCEKNKLLIANDIKKIPFYISSPSAITSQRWGAHIDESEFTILPKANTYTQLDSDNFVVDNKIFNTTTGEYNTLWGERVNTKVNSKHNVLISYKGSTLFSYKLGDSVRELILPDDIQLLKWINNDFFLVQSCRNDPNQNLICKIEIYQYDLSRGLTLKKTYRGVDQVKFQDNYTADSDETVISFAIKRTATKRDQLFIYFMNSTMKEIKSSSTSSNNTLALLDGFIIFNYFNYEEEKDIISMIEVKTQSICSLDSKLGLKYVIESYTSSGMFLALFESDIYKLVSPDTLCSLNEHIDFGESSPWIQQIGKKLFARHQSGRMNIITKKSVLIKEPINGYNINTYDENSIYWYKMNSDMSGLEDMYLENLDTNQTTQLDVNNVQLKCDKDMTSYCYTHDEEVFRYIHFYRDEANSYSYNELKINNRLISTSLVKEPTSTNNVDFDFNLIEMNLKFGTTINLGRNIIYLK
jgi:hypothetical protein